MTDPEGPRSEPPAVPLLLSEPVRVYVYGLAALLVGGLVLAGVLTDEWRAFLLAGLPAVLAVPAAEAARASVYSPATVRDSLAAVEAARAATTVHTRPELAAAVDAVTRAVTADPADVDRLAAVLDAVGQTHDTDGAHRLEDRP